MIANDEHVRSFRRCREAAALREAVRQHLSHDEELPEGLARDLLAVVEAYRGHLTDEAMQEAERAARWYRDIVAGYEKLIALAEARPESATGGGPDMHALWLGIAQAEVDLALCVDKNPANRPETVPRRDWFAREVAEVLKRHLPKLKGKARLWAIASVLHYAGASYPELKGNSSSFYKMLREQQDDHVSKWQRWRSAAAAKERYGDSPI